ncbi:MAG: flagellar biosynthetic protein FliO [Candidatus Cloacimonetes bacterium]|nr:flagellar biosynthetic protein FliO [Candidatus Cloacimonadota bacterium]
MTQRVMGIALALCLMSCLVAQEIDSAVDTTDSGNLDYLFATSTGEQSEQVGARAPAINFFRYMFGLLVVVGLLGLLYYILRRLTGQGALQRGGGVVMHKLAAFALNSKQSLVLVRLLDTVYVLAVSAERVDLVEKIDDAETLKKLTEMKDNAQDDSGFSNLLSKFRKSSS